MKYATIIIFIFILLLSSCSVKEKPIEYGNDKCDYCEMTIVEKKFGAEIVNKNGKAFKFDAAECLLRYIVEDEISEEDASLILVTAVNKPDQLFDAKSGHFLISENLPSPMGAFLTSYDDKRVAKENYDKYGGKLYTWDKLLLKFKDDAKHKH